MARRAGTTVPFNQALTREGSWDRSRVNWFFEDMSGPLYWSRPTLGSLQLTGLLTSLSGPLYWSRLILGSVLLTSSAASLSGPLRWSMTRHWHLSYQVCTALALPGLYEKVRQCLRLACTRHGRGPLNTASCIHANTYSKHFRRQTTHEGGIFQCRIRGGVNPSPKGSLGREGLIGRWAPPNHRSPKGWWDYVCSCTYRPRGCP